MNVCEASRATFIKLMPVPIPITPAISGGIITGGLETVFHRYSHMDQIPEQQLDRG